MKKNRIIPFGYMMRNGEITVNPIESPAVITIFNEYINGKSLQGISSMMVTPYSESVKWNKNMVKRILENEKYIGKNGYPAFIDKETFYRANIKKQLNSTHSCNVSEELRLVRALTCCAECMHRLSRTGGNTRSEKWNCQNPECSHLGYRLTDNILTGAVINVLNTVIENPELLEINTELSIYIPNIDVTRQQNEINRLMDTTQVDFDNVKNEIIRLAEFKYNCCTYNENTYKTEQLKSIVSKQDQLNKLNTDLLKSCVSRIMVSHFYTIDVEFINGVTIKNITERSDQYDDSTECTNNSCNH